MSTPRNRFHDGCWTCKAKRFQCDRTRPHCLTCTQKGFKCEGYEMRLKWGTGIASRGRFAGASQPVETAIPPRPRGRHRDLLREERRREAARVAGSASSSVNGDGDNALLSDADGSPPRAGGGGGGDGERRDSEQAHQPVVSHPRSRQIPPWVLLQGEEEVRLFQEFLEFGLNSLHSTSVNDEDNILAENLPRVCRQSEALCAICITLQAGMSRRARQLVFKYFDQALGAFRAELGRSASALSDGTFTAGLMLSTVGLSRGSAWTMHLHGMYSILLPGDLRQPLRSHTPYRRHLVEVLGYLDLPGFAVGRQNPSIGVWRRHCREPGYLCRPPQLDSVEFVSGLPRSLLDLLSAIDAMEITEEDLWDWPGAPGSLTQYHLWEAYRLAGVLSLRNPQLYAPAQAADQTPSPSPSLSPSADSSSQASGASSSRPSPIRVPASTDVVATRIISHIDVIIRAYVAPDSQKDSLLFNAIDYPLFVAGIEAEVMNGRPELRGAIKNCFAVREEAFRYSSRGTVLLGIMEEWWACAGNGGSVNDLAAVQGLELGLL